MKYLICGFFLFFSSTTLYGSVEEDTLKMRDKDTSYATHALYVGFLAPFYSIVSYNYDGRLFKNIVVRVGITYLLDRKLTPSKTLQYGIFPAYVSSGAWASEIGGGVYYDAVEDKVHAVGIFGVRYQKGESGILFRAGFYPNLPRIQLPILAIGFSIGYAF